jgi:hypothetical protein
MTHGAASRKVVGSRPNEINEFFSILPNPATIGPEVYSVSNRNENQK